MCSKNIPHLTPLRLSHPTHPWHSWLRRDFLLRRGQEHPPGSQLRGGTNGRGRELSSPPPPPHVKLYPKLRLYTQQACWQDNIMVRQGLSMSHQFRDKKKNTSRNSPWGCRSKAMTLTLSMNEFLWPCDPSKILRKCSHLLTTPRSHLDDHGHGKQGVALFC